MDDVTEGQDDLEQEERAQETQGDDMPSDDDLGIGGEDEAEDAGDEPDEEEEPEEVDDEEDPDDAGATNFNAKVPADRLRKAVTERNRLREQNAELEARLKALEGGGVDPGPAAPTKESVEAEADEYEAKIKAAQAEIDKLEDERDEALADAETDKARELRQKLNAKREEVAELKLERRDHLRSEAHRREQERLGAERNELLTRAAAVTKRYPQLADDDVGGDAAARDAVLKIQQRLVRNGTPPIEALEEAAEIWADARGIKDASRTAKAKNKGDARTAESRARHADAEARQPPHTRGLGNERERKPPGGTDRQYTDAEWERLSQDERDAELGLA